MTYARARQVFIAALIAGNAVLAWQWGKSEAEVSRLEGVVKINVQTIARLKDTPQYKADSAFTDYVHDKVRKLLKKKGQADI
jgi:hypothetical protein